MIKGIGTDIIEFERIEKMGVDRLAERILTKREKENLPLQSKRRREFVAGRFAAKEAISKAFGTGIGAVCSFQDIEVINKENGKPIVYLSEPLVDRMFGSKKFFVHLSITHSDSYVIAMAVVEEME